MCLPCDMTTDALIAHLESLLRERREQQTPSPATAAASPPGGAIPPSHAAAGEPINAADWIGLAQVCALVLAVDGLIWLISALLLSLINI